MNRRSIFALMAFGSCFAVVFDGSKPTAAITFLLGAGAALLGHYWLQKP
jgi:VIT1/CCC1 family predicted Fe2+/Mn2+ transporter